VSSVRSSSGPSGTWLPGDRGLHKSLPKLLSRRQPRLNSITPSAKVSTGQRVWKPPPRRKSRRAVIREPNDLWGARGVDRLQKLGRRIFRVQRM
jgi:hypothetical protein